MLKLTHIEFTINGDIFVDQPWFTLYDLTYIHGDHITQDPFFIIIEIDWDKTSLFDFKYRGVNHDTLNGGVQNLIQDFRKI